MEKLIKMEKIINNTKPNNERKNVTELVSEVTYTKPGRLHLIFSNNILPFGGSNLRGCSVEDIMNDNDITNNNKLMLIDFDTCDSLTDISEKCKKIAVDKNIEMYLFIRTQDTNIKCCDDFISKIMVPSHLRAIECADTVLVSVDDISKVVKNRSPKYDVQIHAKNS